MNKILLFLLITFTAFSQEKTFTTQDIEVNSLIKGTLFSPKNTNKKTKLVILIAGSGPTNRSGNQFGVLTNSLKYLSEGLVENNIAVFSYDKRLFAQMKSGKIDEKLDRFDDMIIDATSVLDYFKSQKKFKKIIIAGHSEGSLVGMITALKKADGFISLAGAGRPIDEVLKEQLVKQLPNLDAEISGYLTKLREGSTFELTSKNPTIKSIFRESVQPYMISWIKYNPTIEIKKLKIPVMIINGTKDLQVPESEAMLLKAAYPKAELKIIENMNHNLKEILIDKDNLKSYNDGTIPITPILTETMTKFINSI
ncbi:alpha/beta hydrolase [Flavobacterium sp.]|uniref:alpha/beta hydrolase n=1 Tax=Flavobacterium sp. TaxID=239 RepID=UPI000EE93672|nr:alpha/beta hydrolase [Flavobacterium sp.]HCQ12148.1 alpha/beta hydrolase [Flavobacterium sp.]